mgnify:CR=1 FL=1
MTRHGETNENADGCLQGHTNSVNEIGLKQTKALAQRLNANNVKIDILISSTMTRAKETAQIFSELLHLPVIQTELIREKESGELEGKKSNSVDWNKLEGTFETRKVPGGESLLEVQQRARLFFEQILTKYDDKTVLMVSHGAFLKVFIGTLLGMSLHDSIFKLQIDHSSLSEIEIKARDQCRILMMNNK